jgi:hypothetical protein
MQSHADDGATESCWRWHYRVMLAMALLSHAEDGATESCWRWRYRGDLAVVRCSCRVTLVTMLPSHAGDGATGATWPWCDVDSEKCWQQSWRVMLAMALQLKGCTGCGKVVQPLRLEHRGVVAS